MRELPILFTGAMVRAILSGQKTQTRRVIKERWMSSRKDLRVSGPYGGAGDRLWVRETSAAIELPDGLDVVRYAADEATRPIGDTEQAADDWLAMHSYRRGKGLTVPAIHMPRWASRITLEITGVRIERLQDISEADARAEGVRPEPRCLQEDDTDAFRRIGPVRDASFPIARYAALWESINGPGSWAANPFVWCVSFRRVEP